MTAGFDHVWLYTLGAEGLYRKAGWSTAETFEYEGKRATLMRRSLGQSIQTGPLGTSNLSCTMTPDQAHFGQAITEAANRAEATALVIRCGYRVYRPEADIEGEDLVLRTPSTKDKQGDLIAVQLKPRVYVDGPRYSGLGLYMLFPIGKFTPDIPRQWFLTLHDPLFDWVKEKHGHSPGWTGRWHNGGPSAALRDYLKPFKIQPAAEPEPPEEEI